tara:strand:- start:133 stop:330 length:198 start_codon:yes stop_codon:yes gene_type:complete
MGGGIISPSLLNRSFIDLINPIRVATSVEWRRQPPVDNYADVVLAHHTCTERDHIRVVMGTSELR